MTSVSARIARIRRAAWDALPAPSRQAARRRSGARAALLSFLFPGLGQAYLGRRRAAVMFALPAIVLVAAVAWAALDGGLLREAMLLLDPTRAAIALIAVIALAIWRAASVATAESAGRVTGTSRLVAVVLVATIAVTHFWAAGLTLQLRDAGLRMGSDPLAAGDPSPTPTRAPLSSASPTTRPPATPAVAPTATPGGPFGNVYDDDDGRTGNVVGDDQPVVDVTQLDGANDGLLNVLIVGLDWQPGRTSVRTDTMMVVSVNIESGEVLMFSFPRDIARFPVFDGGTYTGRLNSFARYARTHPKQYPQGGIGALSDEIGYLLGVPIDYWASINIPGFASLIDAIGGVTIYNEKPIDNPGFGIVMPVGEFHLDADTAQRWVRSRHGPGNNDFARARRQQQMLAAIRHELLQPARIAELPRLVDAISDMVNTNFPTDQIDTLLTLANQSSDKADKSYVFGYPSWALHMPRALTNGQSVMFLRMPRIQQLSRDLFGEKSIYWKTKR